MIDCPTVALKTKRPRASNLKRGPSKVLEYFCICFTFHLSKGRILRGNGVRSDALRRIRISVNPKALFKFIQRVGTIFKTFLLVKMLI